MTTSPALWELCHPLELSGVLLIILWIQTIICFCLNSCLQLDFALAVRSGMGCCNGCLLYLDIFYSFSWSYTPNIEWFCDLPGISITAERFFQYSETINYQTTNIFASNKYHLEREEKKIWKITFICGGNTPVQWKKISLRRKALKSYSTNLFY